MRALLDHTQNDQHRVLFELLLSGGLRIGEALGITVSDVNAHHSLLRIEYQLARDGTRTPLKTEQAHRTIDISGQLTRRLLDLAAQRGQLFSPHALIFASCNETGLERKVVRQALKRAAQAAQLATPHHTLHDLRHSHASMLIALEYPIVDVQHRLGHRKPDTTLRIYAHQWKTHDAQQSRIGNQLGKLFASAE